MRTDHASASARSAARAAFVASWRAAWARMSAPIIRPPQMTSRVLVLIDGNYSLTEAPVQSTRPSCLSGLCRFTLVECLVPLLPSVIGKAHNNGSVLPFGNPCSAHQAIRSALLGGRHMDVYLSTRRDLLVVKKGCPIPPVAAPGSWRKRKRVVKVSEEISSALQMQGYYMRKLRDLDRD